MHSIQGPVVVFLALIPPEDMARYLVTAFFTIINLLVTYLILKKFLFKPAIKMIRRRQAGIEADLKNARETSLAANAKLNEANARIDGSVREASTIVKEAKTQAESQSDAILTAAKKEVSEIITRADTDIERMRFTMMEEMREEVADLAVSIASRVIQQTIDEKTQRELVDQFLCEETMRKTKAKAKVG